MLLSNLVSLGQVAVGVVLPVELDLWEDTATEGEGRLDGLVEAVLVEDWQHAWQSHIDKVRAGVRGCRCIAEGSREHLVLRLELDVDFIADGKLPVFHHAAVLLAAFLSFTRGFVLEARFDGEVHGLSRCKAKTGRWH